MSKEISEAIVRVAQSIEEVAENSIGYAKGDHGYTIADSLESIALTFNRYVELLEKNSEK